MQKLPITTLERLMQEAITVAKQGIAANQSPFGAIIANAQGQVIATPHNTVHQSNDPTAHAEVNAIRAACQTLNTLDLTGHIMATTCEPCPMCLGAIYWARPSKIYYGCSKKDAAEIGFDDAFIYDELELSLSERKLEFVQLMRDDTIRLFEEWGDKDDKTEY